MLQFILLQRLFYFTAHENMNSDHLRGYDDDNDDDNDDKSIGVNTDRDQTEPSVWLFVMMPNVIE